MEKISDFQQYITILYNHYHNIHIGTHSNGTVAADGSSSGHWASMHGNKEFDLYMGSDSNTHDRIGFLVAIKNNNP